MPNETVDKTVVAPESDWQIDYFMSVDTGEDVRSFTAIDFCTSCPKGSEERILNSLLMRHRPAHIVVPEDRYSEKRQENALPALRLFLHWTLQGQESLVLVAWTTLSDLKNHVRQFPDDIKTIWTEKLRQVGEKLASCLNGEQIGVDFSERLSVSDIPEELRAEVDERIKWIEMYNQYYTSYSFGTRQFIPVVAIDPSGKRYLGFRQRIDMVKYVLDLIKTRRIAFINGLDDTGSDAHIGFYHPDSMEIVEVSLISELNEETARHFNCLKQWQVIQQRKRESREKSMQYQDEVEAECIQREQQEQAKKSKAIRAAFTL
ncbi:MAG: hypothetical protein CEN89_76 [Candidatus Berkelbacteria bacterium Licking1014_7]|uniref:Uncharacterized protein n=1 Tax=Candidatus Berkelbacteria bacterium Licking1014_7 TaxID=2017147 RepID=A0A554LKK7_9BACT|nr:MAG: hypothetical protein CEN89_76 [Candidatus Berkelbacteria bacterium Licking1014_7]